MTIIQFPKSQAVVYLTKEEIKKFHELKLNLANSIGPGDAKHYKNELDYLISIGRQRRRV